MKKKTKILILILIIVLFGGLLTYFILNNKENKKYKITDDSLKFKEDYEKVNNQKVTDELSYSELNIPSYNPMKYSSYEEIFKLLTDGTGVIYFGFPECPWCRNIVPVLIDSALESNIDTIYYLNIREDRDTKKLNKKGKVVTEKEGTKDYQKLVELLKDNLKEYEGLNNKNIKRIYVPLVVFVKEGKVIGTMESLTSFQERVNGNGFMQMTTEEKQELSNIYKEYFQKLN